MDILTPIIQAHPQAMAVVGLIVALAQFAGLARQLSIIFRKGGSSNG